MDNLQVTNLPITIHKTNHSPDVAWCAQLMASNEPWITLQRTGGDALALLEDPVSEVYILHHDKEPVGFVMIKMKGSFNGYIQNIAIDAPYRGQGIGEAAIGYMEELIFATYPNVFICASSFNTRAQELYRRLGYETVGILKDYIIKGYDEILMRKTLGPIHDFKNRKPANP